MKAPFPWRGGKAHVAEVVWQAMGDVPNYVEPFAGSAAVLLARPTPPGAETINDSSAHVANFWRALKADPEGLARLADWPVNEADLLARRRWLHAHHADLREAVTADPEHYDLRGAAWWLWGQCASIGDSWSVEAVSAGPRVHHLPALSSHGQGIHSRAWRGKVRERMAELATRLRHVRVACGDWRRVLTPSTLVGFGNASGGTVTGVFLDPPYRGEENIYDAQDQTHRRKNGRPTREALAARRDISAEVAEWARSVGADCRLRVVLCGAPGEHVFTWPEVVVRSDHLWMSPGCLKVRKA